MAKKKGKSKSGIYFIIGLLIIVGIYFYKGTPKENPSLPSTNPSQTVDKVKEPVNNSGAKENNNKDKSESESKSPVKNEEPKKNTVPPIPVQETDDRVGEFKVEGIVQAVNETQRVITIEQILDDNSTKVDPKIKVSKEAVMQNSSGELKLSDIQVGATINLIIMKNGYARSVTVID